MRVIARRNMRNSLVFFDAYFFGTFICSYTLHNRPLLLKLRVYGHLDRLSLAALISKQTLVRWCWSAHQQHHLYSAFQLYVVITRDDHRSLNAVHSRGPERYSRQANYAAARCRKGSACPAASSGRLPSVMSRFNKSSKNHAARAFQ